MNKINIFMAMNFKFVDIRKKKTITLRKERFGFPG